MKQTLIFSLLALAAAQAPAAAPGRTIPTITRNILQFSTLENAWLDAVQSHDETALGKIVAESYELRSAAAPGIPTPRAESLQHAQAQAPFASTIEQMAAHEYGDTVVVSFLWKLDVPARSALPQQLFVVDTWKNNDGNWQVVARYTAPTAAAKNGPGAVIAVPAVRKKI